MKVRSLEEFTESVSNCLTWRKHELKNLESFFKFKQDRSLPALMKGALLLTYAHWEGGVKDMAERYLRHVEQQKLVRRKLTSNFLALELMQTARSKNGSVVLMDYQLMIDDVRFNLDHRCKFPRSEIIVTESNLSSRVLQNIIECIGLSNAISDFDQKQRLIDVALLKARNSIAHTGATEDREDVDLAPILADVLLMLDQFKNIVENAAASQAYRQGQVEGPRPQAVARA